MSEQNRTQAATADEGLLPRVPPNRRRQHMAITVHQDTIKRMDQLCVKFQTHRGQIVDRLVEILTRSYATGKVHCVHGHLCQIGRTDLPEVF